MKNRLLFLLRYFLFWYLFFFLGKLLFLLFNFRQVSELDFATMLKIFLYGAKLDISACSYLLVLPSLLVTTSVFIAKDVFKPIVKIYTIAFLVIFSFLIVADLELYKFWGFRIDTTPLLYINTPKEMLASVSVWVVVRQMALFAVILYVFIKFYNRFVSEKVDFTIKSKYYHALIYLLLAASLIIPIRGGFGLAPINTGAVYFSSNEFANHSAVNPIWNAGFSILQTEAMSNPYHYFEDEQIQKEVEKLYVQTPDTIKVLNNQRPNIVLIVLESFMGKAIEPMGGLKGVTPRLNKLCNEGVFFTRMYSSGVRSDKGLVSVISGFPAQTKASIIRYPSKTQALPSIAKELNNNGYHSAYYYGGDIDFASMRSYITNAGYEKIVEMTDFPKTTYGAKWGVHDHYVFKRLLQDIDTSKGRFFYTFFTLSSHEPFDVPMKPVIEGNDENAQFLNSLYYTDSCLGDFIDSARTKAWWNNTLFVFIADHGTLRLGVQNSYDFDRFHIPMLWIGGAVDKKLVVEKIASQTDFPATLLAQLNILPQKSFNFSNNILDNKNNGFAYCAYNSGFCFIQGNDSVAFDADENKVKYQSVKAPEKVVNTGKAMMQFTYDAFLKMK